MIAKFIIASILFVISHGVYANSCHGKFLNPVTDVNWKTLFPLKIAGSTVGDPDKDNATPKTKSKPICTCSDPIPRVGVPIGFFEAFRTADVTTRPYCMVSLGGFQMNLSKTARKGYVHNKTSGKINEKSSFYHVHWIEYPALAWLNFLTNMGCVSPSSELDIAYMTELDPLWDNEVLGVNLTPEAFLFAGNPLAEVACTADCIKSSVGCAINSLFWCSGCRGGVYPLTGFVGKSRGGVYDTVKVLEKFIFKMHRELLLHGSVGTSGLCGLYPMPWWRKDQYKIQMAYPKVEKNTRIASNPIGRTTVHWEPNKAYPIKGEDFSYVIWRRRDCCA